jgi:chlorobactene glucosyltransferase
MLELPFSIERALQIFMFFGAAYFLVLSLSNIVWLRLGTRKATRTHGPMVSVLIPARDEEKNIARCLDSLLTQTYTNYEIIVLDDQSSDSTWQIIRDYQEKHPRVIRAVRGRPLNGKEWAGKPHAMQQLSKLARGEYFLFTDADTVHGLQSIAWAVTNLESHDADCISGYVFQELATLGETAIVPAIYIMSTMVLPLWLISSTRLPSLSFAIGQLIMFRRGAYRVVGGYEAVSGRITDDLAMARALKRAGFRQVFLDVRKHVSCRMYEGYKQSFQGLSKNVYDVIKRHTLLFALAITALVALVVMPLALLPIQIAAGDPAARFTALCVGGFFLTWALVLWDRGLKWWVPILYPVLFVQLLLMAWWSFRRIRSGQGILWKGRELS